MRHEDVFANRDLLTINVENVEKHMIISILKRTHGNKTEAAKQLGTTKRRLYYRVRKYNIDINQFRPAHN